MDETTKETVQDWLLAGCCYQSCLFFLSLDRSVLAGSRLFSFLSVEESLTRLAFQILVYGACARLRPLPSGSSSEKEEDPKDISPDLASCGGSLFIIVSDPSRTIALTPLHYFKTLTPQSR